MTKFKIGELIYYPEQIEFHFHLGIVLSENSVYWIYFEYGVLEFTNKVEYLDVRGFIEIKKMAYYK